MPDTEADAGLPELAKVPTIAATSDNPNIPDISATDAVDAIADKVLAKLDLDGRIARAFQSTKDKRLSALEALGGVDELAKLKDYIKAQSGDVDKAVREFQLDQLLSQKNQVPTSTAAPGSANAAEEKQKFQAWTAGTLNDAGIDRDDPDYESWAGKSFMTYDDAKNDMFKIVSRRAKQAKLGAGEIDSGGSSGKTPGATGSKDELVRLNAQLRKAQIGGDVAERKRLTTLVREKGGVA